MDWLENLRSLKAKSGLTTKELSVKSGLPEPTLEKVFSGQTKNPGINSVQQLVHAMGFTLDDIDPMRKNSALSLTNEALVVARRYERASSYTRKMVRYALDAGEDEELQRSANYGRAYDNNYNKE